jgi:hypothetical protein
MKLICFTTTLLLISVPSSYAGSEFPADEIKAACLKDMAPLSGEPDDLKQAVLSSCINYARHQFNVAHGSDAE